MYYPQSYQSVPQTQANGLARRTALLRHKIAKAQAKAKFIGMIYFFAAFAIAALAFLPMLTLDGTGAGALWVVTFWKPFLSLKNFSALTPENYVQLAIAALYALILITVTVNALRCCGKLKWLFKRKPSRLNGYNRNVFAMEDLGKLFSWSFYVLLTVTFFIYLLTKGAGAKIVLAPPYALIAAAVGAFVHFFGGLAGGSIHLYVVYNGMIEEEKRIGTVLIPFIRNLLQFAVVGVIGWFIVQTNAIETLLYVALTRNFATVLQNPLAFAYPIAYLLIFVCWLVLVKHATGIAEYDRDGAYSPRRAVFRVFTFFILLFAAAAVAAQFYVTKQFTRDCLTIDGVALISFIIECILRKYPCEKEEDVEDVAFDNFMDVANVMGMPQYAYPSTGYGYPQAGYGYPQSNFPAQSCPPCAYSRQQTVFELGCPFGLDDLDE